jgi:hypothetical protein
VLGRAADRPHPTISLNPWIVGTLLVIASSASVSCAAALPVINEDRFNGRRVLIGQPQLTLRNFLWMYGFVGRQRHRRDRYQQLRPDRRLRLRKEDRRAVAIALRAELAALNDGLQPHVEILKGLDALKDPDEGFNVPDLGQQLRVMPELVSKFGLLDRTTIQTVIEARSS